MRPYHFIDRWLDLSIITSISDLPVITHIMQTISVDITPIGRVTLGEPVYDMDKGIYVMPSAYIEAHRALLCAWSKVTCDTLGSL